MALAWSINCKRSLRGEAGAKGIFCILQNTKQGTHLNLKEEKAKLLLSYHIALLGF